MFNFFKRKPDPRIAELESKLAGYDLMRSKYADMTEHVCELEGDLKNTRDRIANLWNQFANHKAVTLSWKWEELGDGSGHWIELEQNNGYSIDPDSIKHKFLAYAPMCIGPKAFDTQLEAKKYLETLYLKNLFLKSHE